MVTPQVTNAKKPRLTIYLSSQELLGELQNIADEQQRSVSNLANIALADWIADYKSKKQTKRDAS
jgi:predicted transcriptional regulator